jgi:predicted permease
MREGNCVQDVRYALRMMRRNLGFTVLAVLVMGIGIGASVSVFSVVETVFLKPLGYRNPERLVMVWEEATRFGSPRMEAAPSDYLDWKDQSGAFEDLAAYAGNAFNLTGSGEPERLDGFGTTPNLFPLLGVRPKLGRWFESRDGLPGQAAVTILSYGLWQRRFSGNPNIIGQLIRIDDEPYQVVGVMPEGFQFPRGDTQLWMPFQFQRGQSDADGRSQRFLRVVGRLKPGVAWQQAESEVKTISARIAELYPRTNRDYGAVVVPLRQDFIRDARTSLWLLLIAGQLVLLIACINVASMLITRGIGRTHEVAVRAALGASTARVARQLLIEGMLLSICGTAAGISVAIAGFRYLAGLIPPALAGAVFPSMDLRLLVFAALVSLFTGIAFGLAPLKKVFRIDLNHAFNGRSIAVSHGRARSVLVAVEIALAIVVVAGTGLIVRTILNIQGVDPGFRQDHVLTMRLEMSSVRYPTPQSRAAYYQTIVDRVRTLPGVVSAGFTTFLPYTNFTGTNGLFVEGSTERPPILYRREVTPEYLAALGVPLRNGRLFTEQDDANHPPVAIVSEGAVKFFGGDPVGKRVHAGGVTGPWLTIVGVVGDIREEALEIPSQRPTIYLQYVQSPSSVSFFNPRDLAIRVQGEPGNLIEAVKHQIWAVDAQQTISQISTLADIVDRQTSNRKLQASLLGLFSATSTLLAALGVYALLSFSVQARQKEFGIRMALGAQRRDVIASALRETLVSIGFGSAAGVLLAMLAVPSVGTLLYGVSPTDPVTLAFAVAIPLLAGLFAGSLPAWRSTRIQPVTALRQD